MLAGKNCPLHVLLTDSSVILLESKSEARHKLKENLDLGRLKQDEPEKSESLLKATMKISSDLLGQVKELSLIHI